MARPNAVLLGRWRDMILSKHGPCDAGARLVAVAVAKFVNIVSLSTYVSAATLAEATGLNERSVRKHLDGLIAAGWLSARARHKTRGWKLREFEPRFPAGVPEEFSGTQSTAAGATDAPEENARLPEDSSPWTGRNFPMDRKKRPTNSGREHEEEPGYGPGRPLKTGETSRAAESDVDRERRIVTAIEKLPEATDDLIAAISRVTREQVVRVRSSAANAKGFTSADGAVATLGQGSTPVAAASSARTRATQGVA